MRHRSILLLVLSLFLASTAVLAQDLAAAAREARGEKQTPSPASTVYTNDSPGFTSTQPAPATVHTNAGPVARSDQALTTKKAQICTMVSAPRPRKVAIGRDNDGHPIYDQPNTQPSVPKLECVDAPDQPEQPSAENAPV